MDCLSFGISYVNMDDKRTKRLSLDSSGNHNAATTWSRERAALNLWYYKTLFF